MNKMQTLNQRDSKWANDKLGWGSGTIGQYGCTLTSLAMMAGLDPRTLNNMLRGTSFEDSAFAGTTKNLIWWSRLEKYTNGLIKFHTRGYGYNEKAILDAVAKYGACLVEVDFDGTGPREDKHWIVALGNKKANDPWSGNEVPTNKYSKWTGWAVIEINKDKEPEMSDDNLMQIEKADFEKLRKNSETLDQLCDAIGVDRNSNMQTITDAWVKEKDQIISEAEAKGKAEAFSYTAKTLSEALGVEETDNLTELTEAIKGLIQQQNNQNSNNSKEDEQVPTTDNQNETVETGIVDKPEGKSIFESKTFWFNVVMTIINSASFVIAMEGQLPESVVVGAVMAQGFGNIILRIWFTTKAITK